MNRKFKIALVAMLLSIAVSAQQIEIGFSPDEGAQDLVLKTVNSAKSTIHLSAYSFTSKTIINALIEAHKRGVDVKCVVDDSNLQGYGLTALKMASSAGLNMKTISIYPIHHDKIIIVDGVTVETGSFNYSDAAAHKNSENVIVIWGDKDTANTYEQHWQNRFNNGKPFI